MSQKFFAQNSEIVNIPSLPPVNRRPIVLIVVATVLVLSLAFLAAGLNPASEEAATISPSVAIPIGNALELQYAQPHLDAINRLPVAYPFGDAMALQYAQPYLDAQAASVRVPFGNALELQYAQANGLAGQSAVQSWGNALELQYAQPHLAK